MDYKDRKEYMQKYQREWVANRRADYFKDKACTWCGNYDRLELDHIDPSTKVSNSIWSWSLVNREVEIAKCQVLCYNCHKIKTRKAYTDQRQHGTYNMYTEGKCRCSECRKASAVMRSQYSRNYIKVKDRQEIL